MLLFLGEWAGAQTPPLLPAAGQWGIVSCNTLQDVLWRDGTGLTVTWLKGGVADDENYFIAWNGGTYHPEQRKFIYAAQGGDSNGADNGIYAFDFASCLHSRIFGPTVNLIPDAEVNSGTWPYVDTAGIYGPAGKAYPQARETYGGECAIPGVGAWVSGGVPWHVYEIIQTSIQSIWYATPTGWQGPFDANGSWYENWCVWDSIQNRVVYQDYSRLRAYYPSAPVGSRVFAIDDGQQPLNSYNRFFSGCFDATRNRVVGVGIDEAGTPVVDVFDLVRAPTARVRLLTGAPWPAWSVAPGLICDPVSGKYVVWPNGGRVLYVLNPETLTVATIVGGGVDPGTPPYAAGSGTWGRFAYDPAADVYLLAPRVTGPVLAFKPDPSRGGGPPTTYALTLATAGTGSGAVSGGGLYPAGAPVTLMATPASGSVFGGWSPSPCAPSFAMPAADLTCTATFTATAAPTVTAVNPTQGARGATLNVVITGANFASGAGASFNGKGITVTSTTFNTAGQVTANITIDMGATLSVRNVTVTNPGGASATLANAFTVTPRKPAR